MFELPPRLRSGIWSWCAISLLLHVLLVLSAAGVGSRAVAVKPAVPLWMSAVESAPPPVAEPPPPPPPEPPPPPAPNRAPKVAPEPAAEPEPEREREPEPSPAPEGERGGLAIEGDQGLAVPTGEGGLAAGGRGQGAGEVGSGSGARGSGPPAAGEAQRKAGPPELSLWMDVEALGSAALTRPGLGFLMAVPGLRDALRGSGIRPFIDLRRVRVRIGGRSAQHLALAGAHLGGEKALLAAAARVAAMRDHELSWRGDASLRASQWLDGSGVDRGLALHADAFVIAERSVLPRLLAAREPERSVGEFSQLRERVVLRAALEDAAHYAPALHACELQAVRLAIGQGSGGYRMSFNAEYATASAAQRGPACAAGLGASAGQLSRLISWLARAESAAEGYRTSLKIGVTSDEIEQLLNELAWMLREPR